MCRAATLPVLTAAAMIQNSAGRAERGAAEAEHQRHHRARQVDRHRAQRDRLAVALVRRDLVQRGHDHRLHRAEREAEQHRADAHRHGGPRPADRPRTPRPAPSIAPTSTCDSRRRCASSRDDQRGSAVTAVAKTPSTRPIAEALKPRSWPRIGTRKACTSQLDDSSQLTNSRRRRPGAQQAGPASPLRAGGAARRRLDRHPARPPQAASGSSSSATNAIAKATGVDQRAGEHRPDHVRRSPAPGRAS